MVWYLCAIYGVMKEMVETPLPPSIWQTYRIPLILGGVSIFVIVFSVILLVKLTQTQTPIQFFSNKEILGDSNQSSSSAKLIQVDIEGAVERPGVYRLPSGSRVDDAIAKSGGLSEEADREALAKNMNRASVLVDGAKIYVPKKGDTASHIIDPLLQRQITSQNESVNINTASQNELEDLPGVGPVTAKKIIDNRPYQTLKELVSKKALGQALFETIKGNLSL